MLLAVFEKFLATTLKAAAKTFGFANIPAINLNATPEAVRG
jgi:hypothetical protein